MILIFSHFIVYNIYFNIIGFNFSIYLINIGFINSIKESNYKRMCIKNI